MSRLDALTTNLARLAGAGLLGTMAGIHFYLWDTGYRSIETIGPLFLLNGVIGAVAAAAVVLVPRRWLGGVAAGGALVEVGTLGGLVLSLTVGLFGLIESTQAELVVTTIWVESAGTVVLGAIAVRELVIWRIRRIRRIRAAPRGADHTTV